MNSRVSFLNRKHRIVWISLMVVMTLVLAACQPAAVPAGTAAVPVTAPSAVPTVAPIVTMAATAPAAANDVMVNVATDVKLGKILVDSKGMTLYMFTKDAPDQSNCAEGCLKAWPPLLTAGSPKAGDGVDTALLGTATMADGSKIVTYNKMPLYYWAKDLKVGDTTGQGVNEVWYVVAPDGKPVGMPGAAPSASGGGAAAANDVAINLATVPALGKVLVDSKGLTLYMFTKDGPNKSNCSGGCLKAWPPLLAVGSVKAGDGVDQSLIGTAAMPDGSKIVTYNTMPLYYYQGDSKPGDVTGQTVNNVWYVVAADGVPMKGQSSDGY